MIIEDDEAIREIFRTVKTIAAVGCSPHEGAKNYVPEFLMEQGYTVIPVNPGYEEVLGRKCYPNLTAIPVKVDMVDCFRPAEDIPAITEEAIAIGVDVFWMQLGIRHKEAADRLARAGIKVIMNRCPCKEVPRLFPGKKC
ncbi:MAG: CoA-binding protein [Oxalobacter formigenes]|nr:CoA-binding protein [Oxalobacter formigenes]